MDPNIRQTIKALLDSSSENQEMATLWERIRSRDAPDGPICTATQAHNAAFADLHVAISDHSEGWKGAARKAEVLAKIGTYVNTIERLFHSMRNDYAVDPTVYPVPHYLEAFLRQATQIPELREQAGALQRRAFASMCIVAKAATGRDFAFGPHPQIVQEKYAARQQRSAELQVRLVELFGAAQPVQSNFFQSQQARVAHPIVQQVLSGTPAVVLTPVVEQADPNSIAQYYAHVTHGLARTLAAGGELKNATLDEYKLAAGLILGAIHKSEEAERGAFLPTVSHLAEITDCLIELQKNSVVQSHPLGELQAALRRTEQRLNTELARRQNAQTIGMTLPGQQTWRQGRTPSR